METTNPALETIPEEGDTPEGDGDHSNTDCSIPKQRLAILGKPDFEIIEEMVSVENASPTTQQKSTNEDHDEMQQNGENDDFSTKMQDLYEDQNSQDREKL